MYQNLLFIGRNYTRLEDIRDDLLSGEVKGALIDAYVAAERRDLFDDPALYIDQVNGENMLLIKSLPWLRNRTNKSHVLQRTQKKSKQVRL